MLRLARPEAEEGGTLDLKRTADLIFSLFSLFDALAVEIGSDRPGPPWFYLCILLVHVRSLSF